MKQCVLFVCLVINCLAGAQVQQQPPPSDSSVGCQKISEVIADLTAIAKRLTDMCDATVRVPPDCSDIGKGNNKTSGVYQIYVPNNSTGLRDVYCDFSIPGQSWLVFQRRKDGSEDFDRTWEEYAKGFGNLNEEFWLGNDVLSFLTNTFQYKLRIDLEDRSGEKTYAEYSSFKVASSADNYTLTVSGYSGNAGDGFSYSNGSQFHAVKAMTGETCLHPDTGFWWYNACFDTDLNGLYTGDLFWYSRLENMATRIKFSEMKIARV